MSVCIQLYGRNTGSDGGQQAQCSKLKPRVSTEASMMDFCRQWPAATSRSVLLDQGMSALVTTGTLLSQQTDRQQNAISRSREAWFKVAHACMLWSPSQEGCWGDAPQEGSCFQGLAAQAGVLG